MHIYIYIYIYAYIQRGKAAFPPPCVPLSRGGSGWAQPPSIASGLSSKLNFIQNLASKNFEKCSKFLMKSLPKCSKIEALRVSGHLPGRVLEGSGLLLGGSWVQEAQRVICRLLSGRSWAAPEPSWGPSWTKVETQDGLKYFQDGPRCF